MRQGRDYWSRNVAAWRRSELSRKRTASSTSFRIGRYAIGPTSRQSRTAGRANDWSSWSGSAPAPSTAVIERYVLRLWPHMGEAQLREVLAVLESNR